MNESHDAFETRTKPPAAPPGEAGQQVGVGIRRGRRRLAQPPQEARQGGGHSSLRGMSFPP
jgi:hypothetical protein